MLSIDTFEQKVMSTIGQGLLPQQYVDALQPLQNGVPPRNYDEISHIIEDSTGKTMHELFDSFDEVPIGSASIAQVHRATLRPRKEGEEPVPIVLKVQYPDGETDLIAPFSIAIYFNCLIAGTHTPTYFSF